MIPVFPWAGLAIRLGQGDDLRGTGLAGHQNVIERQAPATGRAGPVDHVAHRLADIRHVIVLEVHLIEPADFRGLHQTRLDVPPRGKPSRHHCELQRVGQVVALPDRGIGRVVVLPGSLELFLQPRGRGNRAEKLADNRQLEGLTHPDILGEVGDLFEPDIHRHTVEIAVAGLVDRLGHVDPAVVAPAIEEAVADPYAAAAGDRIVRVDTFLQEGHAVHRLYGGSGRVEPFQHLVAQRHPLVFPQHCVFHAADPGGKAVRIETRHGGHAKDVTRAAIHHHRRAAFKPDATRGVVLQRPVDGQVNGVALNVVAGFQLLDDAAGRGDLDPPRARFAAQFHLELLLTAILADLEARRDEQGVAFLLVLLGVGWTDITEQVSDGGSGRVEAREASLRNDTGQIRQPDAYRSEVLVIEPDRDLDRLERARFVDPLGHIGYRRLSEIQDLAELGNGCIGIDQLIGNDVDAKIRPVRSQRRAVAVEDPPTARSNKREIDTVALGLEFPPRILRDGDVSHARGEQHSQAAHAGRNNEAPTRERRIQRRSADDLPLAVFGQPFQPTLRRLSRKRSSTAIMRAKTGKSRTDNMIWGPSATKAGIEGTAPDTSIATGQ